MLWLLQFHYSVRGGGRWGRGEGGVPPWDTQRQGQGDAFQCQGQENVLRKGACGPEVYAGGVLGCTFFSIPVSLLFLPLTTVQLRSPFLLPPWAPHSPWEHGPGHLYLLGWAWPGGGGVSAGVQGIHGGPGATAQDAHLGLGNRLFLGLTTMW